MTENLFLSCVCVIQDKKMVNPLPLQQEVETKRVLIKTAEAHGALKYKFDCPKYR